jgi:hypothetical protein
MIRKAIYSGSFYEDNPAKLKLHMDKWFRDIEAKVNSEAPIGLICPHAGYMYSGFCAATAYKTLENKDIKTSIIVHPSHRANHFGLSISPFTEYETPFGNLLLDGDIAQSLCNESTEVIDAEYHQSEHSMEVQLPFLYYLNPNIKVVPIMIGNQNKRISQVLSEMLIKYTDKETVIIVSSDLSHYHTAEIATQMDRVLINNIIALDTDSFYKDTFSRETEACGFAGILTMMNIAKLLDESKITELMYTHSGFTSGDFNQVVGYLSAILYRGSNHV